ncbi:hypothetical protein ACSSS7_004116 [Eimeria intestinalis]
MEVRAFLYEDSSVQASFTRSFRLPDENLSASSSAEEGKTIPSETRDDPIISGARKSGRDREGKARCSSISLGLSGTLVESPEKFARQVMETIRDNEEVVLQEIDEFFKERGEASSAFNLSSANFYSFVSYQTVFMRILVLHS